VRIKRMIAIDGNHCKMLIQTSGIMSSTTVNEYAESDTN
jgi:hypothetical protein